MKQSKPDSLSNLTDEGLKLIILIHSAFATASVAAIVQISSREQMTVPLLVSIACFAVCLPFSPLVVLLLNYRFMNRTRWSEVERQRVTYWPSTWFVQGFRYISYTAGFGGFLAMFWSFHSLIGLLFLIASGFAMGIALAAEYHKTKPLAQPGAEQPALIKDR